MWAAISGGGVLPTIVMGFSTLALVFVFLSLRREAEARRRQQRNANYAAWAIKNETRLQQAEIKATGLLREVLGPKSIERYRVYNSVEVRGSKTGHIYEVGATSVYCATTGCGYCVYAKSKEEMPRADQVLSLALTIRCNEVRFLRTANRR